MSVLVAAFAVGTFWFWALLLTSFVVITASVENDKGFLATLSFICSLLALNYFSRIPIIQYILVHPVQMVEIVLAYLALGSGWGFVKWIFFVHGRLEHYNEYRAEYLAQRNSKELTPELAAGLMKQYTASFPYPLEIPPQVRKHKSDIIRWMSYWPFSAFWTLVHDPIRRLFRFIYVRLQHTMQQISDRIFKSAKADFDLASAANEVSDRRRY